MDDSQDVVRLERARTLAELAVRFRAIAVALTDEELARLVQEMFTARRQARPSSRRPPS